MTEGICRSQMENARLSQSACLTVPARCTLNGIRVRFTLSTSPRLFRCHPNLSDEVNHNIVQSEIEGGVFLSDLPPATVLGRSGDAHGISAPEVSDTDLDFKGQGHPGAASAAGREAVHRRKSRPLRSAEETNRPPRRAAGAIFRSGNFPTLQPLPACSGRSRSSSTRVARRRSLQGPRAGGSWCWPGDLRAWCRSEESCRFRRRQA